MSTPITRAEPTGLEKQCCHHDIYRWTEAGLPLIALTDQAIALVVRAGA